MERLHQTTTSAEANHHYIRLLGLTKEFRSEAGVFKALKGLDLTIQKGEYVGIIGRSGSGKTTLLNLLTGIDRPTTGEIHIGDTTLRGMSENQMANWRGRHVGIVFQFYQLIPTLTVLENVMLPMDFSGFLKASERKTRAYDLLERVGIADQAGKLPYALSGGAAAARCDRACLSQ